MVVPGGGGGGAQFQQPVDVKIDGGVTTGSVFLFFAGNFCCIFLSLLLSKEMEKLSVMEI